MLEKIIEGDYILRKLKLSDAKDIASYCNDRKFSKYTRMVPYPYKLNHAVAFIKDSQKKWKSGERYTYGIQYQGRIIGAIGVMMRSPRVAELGYSLSRKYWGKGIITRLVKTVINVSFKELKLHKIFARCNPENKGSEKVMKNVGMKYEAYMREHEEIKGEFWDLIQYGILRREFK